MNDSVYEDNQCWYHGGDPRLEHSGEAKIEINENEIVIHVHRRLQDHEGFFLGILRDGVTDIEDGARRVQQDYVRLGIKS